MLLFREGDDNIMPETNLMMSVSPIGRENAFGVRYHGLLYDTPDGTVRPLCM